MKILVGCEYSGIVSQAFRAKGHDVTSCDLLPSESPGKHIVGDLRDLLSLNWDMIIAHPPCTYLCRAQGHRVHLSEFDVQRTEAVQFVKDIMDSKCEKIAVENPIGLLTRLFRPPDQIIYPYWFGDPHSKDIALWLKNLPPLIATMYHTRRQPVRNHVNGRMSQAEKSKIKSRFFPLVAEAMANQWS